MTKRTRDAACLRLVEGEMKRVTKNASLVSYWAKVAQSNEFPEAVRRKTFKKLAKFYFDHGFYAEALLFTQLSVKLRPATEAFARALLNGSQMDELAIAAIKEMETKHQKQQQQEQQQQQQQQQEEVAKLDDLWKFEL
jgi:hypothetical protein